MKITVTPTNPNRPAEGFRVKLFQGGQLTREIVRTPDGKPLSYMEATWVAAQLPGRLARDTAERILTCPQEAALAAVTRG